MSSRRCPTGKTRHETKHMAEVSAANAHRALNQRGLIAETLYSYRCRTCRGWHLTRRAEWDGKPNHLARVAASLALQEWAGADLSKAVH